MKLEYKRDIDGWVVYVDGWIRKIGFPSKRAAREWARRELENGTTI